MERREYAPVDEINAEYSAWLEKDGKADIVTLAGSGEPTLNSRFGDVLRHVSAVSSIPTAVLTNSTLLFMPEVRRDLCCADIAKVSLSAWDDESMHRINHPAEGVTFSSVYNGIAALREEFQGRIWLEVFFAAGVNDSDDAASRIAECVTALNPDHIHLNTVVRTPALDRVRPVSQERMEQLSVLFGPNAEIIARFTPSAPDADADESKVLAVLMRRPCTVEDIAGGLSISLERASELVESLLDGGRIEVDKRDDGDYFIPASRSSGGEPNA
jgi:wyosine [tRNA(Phe)-imidazoG37] synthetase (radical SAM superfamily)